MFRNSWNTIFVNTYKEVELEKSQNSPFDKKVLLILLIVPFSLIFIQYFGNYQYLIDALETISLDGLADSISSLKRSFPNDRLFYLTQLVLNKTINKYFIGKQLYISLLVTFIIR